MTKANIPAEARRLQELAEKQSDTAQRVALRECALRQLADDRARIAELTISEFRADMTVLKAKMDSWLITQHNVKEGVKGFFLDDVSVRFSRWVIQND